MSQDSRSVVCSKKLKFKDWDAFHERIAHVAQNPNDMTPQEMLSSYFLNKVFWEKFGKGRHELFVRHWVIRKKIHNGTYKSNSGKRMGHFTPFFRIKNRQTGKIRHIGMGLLTMVLEREMKYRPNRRNDPDRN